MCRPCGKRFCIVNRLLYGDSRLLSADGVETMSDKIAVISMVKNESDIIESFIRYYAAFADCIIIADHNSDDGTWEIMEKLKAEYPFLITSRVEQMGYIQSEIMTNLMESVANDYRADWILPMDADEFLLSEGQDDVRIVLGNCSDNVLLLPWIDHEVPEACYDRKQCILNLPCRRAIKTRDMNKVIVRGDYIRNGAWRLKQGNHGLEAVTPNCDEPSYSACDDLVVAHFPFRSKEQYISKNVLGWLANVAAYSKHTHFAHHWKKAFDRIVAGDVTIPDIGESKELGCIVKEKIALKYPIDRKNAILGCVLHLSERVFNEYAVMKTLNNAPEVNLYMLVTDDFDALVVTVESLLKQTFTDWRLYLILPDDIDSEVENELNNIDDRISSVTKGSMYQYKGNFVKFLEPGVELNSSHLSDQLVPLINHADVDVSYSNGEKREGYIGVNTHGHNNCSGNNMIKLFRQHGYRLSGGISSFLFRELDAGLVLSDYIDGEKWQSASILENLLRDRFVYVEEAITLKVNS